jgi:hypothetical protein
MHRLDWLTAAWLVWTAVLTGVLTYMIFFPA